MPGLVPGISLRDALCSPDRDGRDKPGHDGSGGWKALWNLKFIQSLKRFTGSPFALTFI
jgi:hypothetical protein